MKSLLSPEFMQLAGCLYRLGPFSIRNLGSNEYAIPGDTLTAVNLGDRLRLTDSFGTDEFPIETGLMSADFNVCEGSPYDAGVAGARTRLRR